MLKNLQISDVLVRLVGSSCLILGVVSCGAASFITKDNEALPRGPSSAESGAGQTGIVTKGVLTPIVSTLKIGPSPDSVASNFSTNVDLTETFNFTLSPRKITNEMTLIDSLASQTESKTQVDRSIPYPCSVITGYFHPTSCRLSLAVSDPVGLSVTVDGVSRSDFSLDPTKTILTFSNNLTRTAQVVARWRNLNGSLATSFAMQQIPKAGSLQVSVVDKANRLVMGTFPFTVVDKVVTFSGPSFPPDAATIRFTYDYVSGLNRLYAVMLQSGAADFTLSKAPNMAIAFTLAGNQLTLAEASISSANLKAGDKLIFAYNVPDASTRELTLPHVPLADTISLQSNVATCKVGQGLVVSGNKLTSMCLIQADSAFVLSYKYRAIQTVFDLGTVKDPQKCGWKVFLGSTELSSNDYVQSGLNGTIFTLKSIPPANSVVSILCTYMN